MSNKIIVLEHSANERGMQNRRTFAQTITVTSILKYFILVPALFPKGPQVTFPFIKSIIALWSMFSLVVMLFDYLVRVKSKMSKELPLNLILCLLYFFAAIIITVLSRKGIESGLQELFYFPVIFFYLCTLEHCYFKQYVRSIAVMLIPLFSIELFSIGSYSGTLTFLGHVQSVSQYGLLGIYAGFLLLSYGRKMNIFIGAILCILSCCVLFASSTESSHYCLAIVLIVSLLLFVVPKLRKVDCRVLLLCFLVINCLVLFVTIGRTSMLIGTELDWTFNGRDYVWRVALSVIRKSPLLGYGVENSSIQLFWSASGMSYAHNQILQSLVDGGLVLLLLMLLLLFVVASAINTIHDDKLAVVAKAIFCALGFFMIFDSFSIYCYVFVLFALFILSGNYSQDLRSGMGDR